MNKDEIRAGAVKRCREKGIIIPTLAEQKNPHLIPKGIARRLADVDSQAVDPLNLYRITWYNDPDSHGFGPVNALELPSELTGVPARIVGLVGRHFPTGAHKVGAALVGTFLGILLSYGFVQPLASNMEAINGEKTQAYNLIKQALLGFHKGMAPSIAVEFARRSIADDVRPGFVELEDACKATRERN